MSRFFPALLALAFASCTADIFPGSRSEGPGSSVTGAPKFPISIALSSPQVRVLSAPEYRRTVKDLLGLNVTTPLSQSDWTAGFDNGAGIQVDGNLLSALLDEAELLATEYLASRAAIDFACFDPADLADACVKTMIEKLGRRAYRRPLAEEQRDQLFGFFQSVAADTGDRRTGLQMVVARLVSSPQFLYRSEVGRPTTPGGDLYQLDAFEKASLIAYTLTGTMPDEALLADAEAGLLDDDGLRHHIRRLWRTNGARRRVGDFFRQWLKVTRLEEMAARPADSPKLTTPALGAALKGEFDAFVSEIVFDGQGTLGALFTENVIYADANTAPLYGAPAPQGIIRMALESSQRQGVLTLASTMAAIASADDASRDRPVMRGLMVKRQLLCEDVGPPSGVNTLAARATAQQTPDFDQLTTREQYEAMMQQGEQCQSCHRQFMPLGFALGRYDALGRFRTEQRGRPIDASVHGVPFAGAERDFSGALELSDALASNPATADCFSKNFVAFATGASGTEHADTLSAAMRQKLGDGPLFINRLVEETLAARELYLRRGVPFVASPPVTSGAPDAGTPLPATTLLLASGAQLAPDGFVLSTDGLYKLLYQLDGNLVLYKTAGGAVWASNTPNTSPGKTAMQGDGNLVVYDAANVARFNTGTHGNSGATLRIDAGGTLYVIAPGGTRLWSSKGTP